MIRLSWKHLSSVAAVLTLAGCLETTQAGLPVGAASKFSRIAVVSTVSDQVASTYWSAAFAEPKTVDGRLGINANGETLTLVRGQLEPAGASVKAVSSHTGAAARSSDAVLVLQQTPLDKLGQDYNPGRDFFVLGGGLFAIAGMAANEEKKDQRYKPRFVVWLRNHQANKALIGENACTVGLTASLLNPADGTSMREGVQVTGRSVIPGDLTQPVFAQLPEAQKAAVRSHCRLALRSAVSQALRRLDVAG